MAIAIEGTPTVDGYQAGAASFTCNLPSSPQAGELLIINAICGDQTKWLEVTGWTTVINNRAAWGRNYIWKVSDGSETGAVTVDVKASGSTNAHLSCFRISGLDTTDPFNGNNTYGEVLGTTSTPEIPFNSLAITSGNGILAGISCEAVRTVTVYPAALDTEVVMSADSFISNHIYLDITEVDASNPAYSFTMSDSRAYGVDLIELNLAGTSASNHTVSFSEAVTAASGFHTGMSFTKGAEVGVVSEVTTGTATDVIYSVLYATGPPVALDVVTRAYDDTVGDIVNADGVKLASFTTQSVTNCED